MRIQTTLACAVLAAAPLAVAFRGDGGGPSSERAALQALQSPALAEMRAGAPARSPALATDERQLLRQAQTRSQALEALRAGDLNLSDSDVNILLLAVAVALLIVIIA